MWQFVRSSIHRRLMSTDTNLPDRFSIMSYMNENKGAIGVILGVTGASITGVKLMVDFAIQPVVIELRALEKQVNDKFASMEKSVNDKFASMEKQVNDKFASLDQKMDTLIRHIHRVEDRYAQYGERLAKVEERVK
jgi:hypothetical protein